jgi:outer membrane biosynthesis protein TonB
MASITSVISFFILLLATYSYSAPVAYEYENSTPQFEFTTGTTIVEHVTSVNMQLLSDDESTVVPNMGKNQPSVDFNSEEATTSGVHHSLHSFLQSSSPSGESNEKRSVDELKEKRGEDEPNEERSADEPNEESSADEPNEKRSADEPKEKRGEDESNEKRTADEPKEKRGEDESNEKRSADESKEKRSEDESKEKRGVDGFMYTTMETSTDFNQRAIRPVESQEEFETSTSFYSANHMIFTTDFEPSSSVDSFAKSTGLLHSDQTTEQTSTFEYQPNEESTTRFPVKTQKFVKTISIIPGKITKTKIYANAPQ